MDDLVIILAVIAGLAVGAAVAFALRGRSGAGNAALAQAMDQLRETAAKLDTNQQILADRLGQTQSHMGERLDALHKRLGDGFQQHTEKTGETLQQLSARLAVIDQAQKNITDLSQQMVSLQDILSNKQARGAFGETQLNDLVKDTLPIAAYELQATLSNGKRADCLLKFPNPPGPIAVDAKFPLESYRLMQDAKDEAGVENASREFSKAIRKHIGDIAERYIVPGETADSAIMFLPSESLFLEVHSNPKLAGVIEECRKRRVYIVSPNTLWATLITLRAILRDARMSEQAGLIQIEVTKLLEDVGRLDERVQTLRKRFDSANKAIEDVEISKRQIVAKGNKIEAIELDNSISDESVLESSAQDNDEESETLADPQDRLKLV